MALVDVAGTLAVAAVLAAMSAPCLDAWLADDRARLAARYLAAVFQRARTEALRRNVHVAVRFGAAADDFAFTRVVDGNGDGVRQADVAAGVDRVEGSPDRLVAHFGVGPRVRAGVPSPDEGARVAAGADPIQVGRARLVSFSPLGTCTSGTIYVAGRDGIQAAVRLFGATGRMRVLWWDERNHRWRED